MKRNFGLGVLYLLGLLLVSPPFLRAADYLGAAAVVQKISEKPETSASDKPPASAQLKRDIETFKKQSASLTAAESAQQWLKLLDRQFDLAPSEMQRDMESQSGEGFNPQDIWMALPGPTAWDALRVAIEARPPQKGMKAARELSLQLVVHTLTADRKAQTNDLARMDGLAAKTMESDSYMLGSVLDQISQQMLENSGDADVVMKSLEHRLANEREGSEFSVPNLLPLVGEQRTAAFLRQVFSNATMEVNISQGEETKKLARKIALEMVAELKVPQWRLTYSLDAGPLFEALEKRFPSNDSDTNQPEASADLSVLANRRRERQQNNSYEQARVYYLFNLISQNRSREAVALAQKSSGEDSMYVRGEVVRQLEQAGYTKALHDFFYELLSQNPDLPFWDEYIGLAAQVGETDKMLELARKTAAREDVSGNRRDLIRQNLYRALLAADRVDEGVAEIREIISQPAKAGNQNRFENVSRGALALTLAEIGRLLNNTNWMEEGIRLAREEISRAKNQNPETAAESSGTAKGLADFLAEIGRGPEAELLLAEELQAENAQPARARNYSWGESGGRADLSALISIYYRAGRYSDVLLLLDQAPGWNAKDLADLRDTYLDNVHQHEDSPEDSIRHDVAASLIELGRKDEAKKVANAILDDNGGYDPAYELLVKIGGADLLPRLDELFARDQFEERPLIWKAVVLQQAGKLEEAEAAARKAISIDPSDGEQGPGRRMRAYAVLSEIRKARGDEKEAELFRGAVDAIRLSETADRYYQAGLLKQAIGMYEDSLLKFEGAYCIQSRLALRLSEAGKHEEAAEHYRRAYELMPDSFGRVESHCFGCEQAFAGQRAQSIAEKVFTSLARSNPQKPQVHYLLGYLREEQGNYAEALTHFRDAVKLDADYLNAWKHIESVGREYFLSPADRDAIALNMLRLDPLGRHGGRSSFSDVTDLRALWNAVESARRLQPKLADTLYALPASKAQLEKLASESKETQEPYQRFYPMDFEGKAIEPARAVLQNGIISATMQLLQNNYGFMD